MVAASAHSLALQAPEQYLGIIPLDERELATIEGGNIWAGLGMTLGGAGIALLLGVAVGVAVYCIFN